MEKTRCNLCGFGDLRLLLNEFKEDPKPHPVVYQFCTACSFVTLCLDYKEWLPSYSSNLQEMSASKLHRYVLQEMAETWSVLNDLLSLKKYYSEEVDYIYDGNDKLVADIGCGVGGSLRAYQELGWQTLGIEPGEREGWYARDVLGFDVRTEYYSRTSFPRESLDMIHSYHTLEHIEFPYQFINNFAYHLRPSGLLYIETPNILDTANLQLGFGHISMFSPGTLKQTLQACGFEIIQILNRSYTTTFGVGILARRKLNLVDMFIQFDKPYLNVDALRWRKDGFLKLKMGLAYAFWVGRSRKVTLISLPWRLIEIIAEKYVAPLYRKLRRIG